MLHKVINAEFTLKFCENLAPAWANSAYGYHSVDPARMSPIRLPFNIPFSLARGYNRESWEIEPRELMLGRIDPKRETPPPIY